MSAIICFLFINSTMNFHWRGTAGQELHVYTQFVCIKEWLFEYEIQAHLTLNNLIMRAKDKKRNKQEWIESIYPRIKRFFLDMFFWEFVRGCHPALELRKRLSGRLGIFIWYNIGYLLHERMRGGKKRENDGCLDGSENTFKETRHTYGFNIFRIQDKLHPLSSLEEYLILKEKVGS